MADLFEAGAALVAEMQKAHMSRTVTVRRGASEIQVAATIGRTEYEIENGDASLKHQSRDFIVDVADYDFGAGAVEPAIGDEIDETIDGAAKTYRLLDLPDSPPWEFADAYRKRMRLHTKETAS